MHNLWSSVAFRLSLVCGALVVATVIVLSTVFYVGTVGVLAHGADDKIANIAQRLTQYADTNDLHDMAGKIEQALADGIDSDTEIYMLADASGHKLAGNIPMWTGRPPPLDRIVDQDVLRDGRASMGRMLLRRLPDGSLLVVGRDMSDLHEIDALIWRAIGVGSLLALVLSVAGTLLFRSLIESKVGAIRHAALEIEAGNLSQRIAVAGESDEFARLGRDLNRMLDKIEYLMEGIRHVSNAIAHNLRTPLGRIRGHLEEALRSKNLQDPLVATANAAIEEIDRLINLFNSLLQIAEAESGARRQTFVPVELREIVTNIVELYDAAAEEIGVTLTTELEGNPVVRGDRELLASALANLLDNALKYAGNSAVVGVHASQRGNMITLMVHDDGPGIPPHEHAHVLQRFYRLDHGGQPGSGIGLSMVAAVVELHGGQLQLEDAMPGLLVRMTFPCLQT